MTKRIYWILLGFLSLTLAVHAQPAAPTGPNFDAATAKLFGKNQTFSANMELQTKDPEKGDLMTMPGKISFDTGKSRFEMDLTQLKSSRISQSEAEQMKQMGMETIVTIGRPDKQMSYLIYPGLQAYVANPTQTGKSNSATNDFKIETTELGKDTVDGHPCVKNKVVVTDKDGNQHESTVWNATDLKNFPVKVQMNENGNPATMTFKDISFSKPAASQFEPPADYTKYNDVSTMIRSEMMKKMSNAMFNH